MSSDIEAICRMENTSDTNSNKAAGMVVAIDGPSASGKSTNARMVAAALGYWHVDTGAMFRTLSWYCLKEGVNPEDPAAVEKLCDQWPAELKAEQGRVFLTVDGYEPAKEIREESTSAIVSKVASVPKVREWMKLTQRECARFGSLVMEGRDIGTHIFPDTPYKFYLQASLEERNRRRAAEGVNEDLSARDKMDSGRKVAPLKIANGAVVLDNTGQTPEQSRDRILAEIQRIQSGL